MSSTRPAVPTLTALDAVVGWLGDAGHRVDVSGAGGVSISGISLSTERVQPGDLYAALPGARAHGADFVVAAVAAGAVAVLSDAAGRARCREAGVDVPVIVVEAPRDVLGLVSAGVYGEPARAMTMIGVTGTQGKTTTTRLAESGLLAAGVPAAVIGTVGTRIAGVDVKTSLTTPEAPDLHGLFALMREQAVGACCMEVSSHALVLGRVDGVVFDVAVFLNLGRDHLDFHDDVEDYFQAKASLFTPEHARLALINVDDEHGRRLAAETALPVRTFSTAGATADWTATDIGINADEDGLAFVVHGPDGLEVATEIRLPGSFNVSNALAAVAAAAEAGHDPRAVADGLSKVVVPGRMERIAAGQRFLVVVDYAHKPDAVEAAVTSLRPVADEKGGRVLVVLGAGGDRDRGKRPVMGEIAARLADVLIVTDDNPRTEDPATIRAEVLAGTSGSSAEVLELGDRRAAITAAIDRAGPDDVVLVAGKGHETGQEVHGVVHEFDDRTVALEALHARLAREGGDVR
ncbi:UDP-N-acetylmuramoyl-L-alanyl-D-glutamate--2,6-diaminopimelate ligase [Nocardioides sp.]|uniref:UDP-N-acetylmuramoyl-L-alanyl-D-glutamate--2, 6-diaminopimelate ligase n=1 Tax=Nocardioides sp. TaxID=35761 RepID=UPI002B279E66|nr:UDP-N-acetylmuramoyl-L-alanyl-D-glutamate--2,6-diaminopimelate ligase [Nocardioides sp.]